MRAILGLAATLWALSAAAFLPPKTVGIELVEFQSDGKTVQGAMFLPKARSENAVVCFEVFVRSDGYARPVSGKLGLANRRLPVMFVQVGVATLESAMK